MDTKHRGKKEGERGKRALINLYTKTELQEIVEKSDTMSELAVNLGYTNLNGSNSRSIRRRLKEFKISTKHFGCRQRVKGSRSVPLENVFCKNSHVSSATLRIRYKDMGFTPYECALCGQGPVWNNNALPMILNHIDGNKSNNVVENLRWLCPNCNEQLPILGRKETIYDSLTEKKKRRKYKTGRKSKIKKRNKRPKKSKQGIRDDLYKNHEITKLKLKKLIREHSFTEIGIMYGVSDNSVRNWCKQFNLPRTKSEIRKYTDEEWSKL